MQIHPIKETILGRVQLKLINYFHLQFTVNYLECSRSFATFLSIKSFYLSNLRNSEITKSTGLNLNRKLPLFCGMHDAF